MSEKLQLPSRLETRISELIDMLELNIQAHSGSESEFLNKVKIQIFDVIKQEREASDKKYAIKLVEVIVFTLVGILCVGVIGALLKLVILGA